MTGIWLEYDLQFVIYQWYARFMSIHCTWQVYEWYMTIYLSYTYHMTCIWQNMYVIWQCMSYDRYIPTSNFLRFFGTGHVTVWTDHMAVLPWPVPKKRRKFEVGIYRSYDLDGHMTFFYLLYTCHMTDIWQIDCHIPVIWQVYDRYMTNSWSYPCHMTGIYHNVIYQVYTWYMTVI